jgi:hypothetical protein
MTASRVLRLASRGIGATALLLTLSSPASAQIGASTGLMGKVTDASGAAVPKVAVTITNVDTGETRTVTSDATGDWEARFLTLGTYRVVFELSGFKTMRRDGITVSTAEMAAVNVVLDVGGLAEAVDVVANADMVSSNTMTVSRTLDQKELEALPTSARNFTQLLVIEPGVSADISELLSNDNASISPSVNGARTTNNSFVFNGMDVTNLLCCNSRVNGSSGTIDNGGGSLSRNVAPAPETLQEVKLQTSLYDAATGRNGGGNFTLVSKSGTNSFRGSGYYYNQNDALMANDFFFNRAGIEKPILDRHEGGGTIGGPIVRNRTFFFGSYQRTQAETSFVDEASNTILLPRALTDDRSDAGINAFAAAIWNPIHGPVNFNVINPISRALLKATFADGTYLIPSGSGGTNCRRNGTQLFESCQVTSVIPATFAQHQFSTNLDHQLTTANRLSGKYFFSNQPSRDPLANGNALTRFEREETTYQRTFSLTDLHIFSPSVVNEFRGGFFRNRNDSSPVSYFTNSEFGIVNPLDSKVPDLTQLDIRGDRDVGGRVRFGTPSDGTRIYDLQTTYTIGNTTTLTKGKHSIRAGGEVRRHHLDGDLREGQNRRHNFRSWFDFLTVGYRNPSDGNRARQISDSSITYGETARAYRMTDATLFIAEDWRMTSDLTLNLGVRWEYFGFPSEANGLLAVFDFPAALETGNVQDGFVFASNFDPNSVPGAAGLPLKKAGSKTIVPGDYDNVMPRVGFAWTPTDQRNFAIRGGYGMFYERTTGGFANSLRQAPPFFRELQLNNLADYNIVPTDFPALPIPSMSVAFDDGEPILVGSNDPDNEFEALETQMVSPDLQTPRLQQWSLNTQWEFRPDWLLEVGYIGTKGDHLLQFINQNQALDIDALGGFQPRAGVPGGGFTGNYYTVVNDRFVNTKTPPPGCDLFDDPGECVVPQELRGPLLGLDEDEGANTLYSNGKSWYHALQTSVQKRFAAGYLFNVNYTFSRAIDYFSDEGLFQIEHDQTRPENNQGLSDYHRKHRLILSWAWDLPFRGNPFVEGWQIAGIGTFQSGRPFTVTDGEFSAVLVSTTNPRPNLAPGATHDDQTTQGSVNSRLDNYLNPDAFESSGTAFGDLGRNTVIGPDQRRVDLSLSKMTRVTGNQSIEFRLEAYNVTNTPTFRNPARDISAANFGQITRTRGGPRVIQLGLKYRF